MSGIQTASTARSASAAAFEPARTAAAAADDRSPRRTLNHESYVLRAGGAKLWVELIDFSADGCCVAGPSYLWRGEDVKLYLPWRGMIDATVCWCREGKTGLVFADIPEARTERVERNAARIDTVATVTFRRVGKSRFKVAVHDLSPHGCKVELVERPQIGELVQVKFEGLDSLDAEVRWVDGHEAGVEFGRAIHPAVFDMLAVRLSA